LANKSPKKPKGPAADKKNNGYEQEIESAKKVVAEAQEIVNKQKDEVENARIVLDIHKQNKDALDKEEQEQLNLLALDRELSADEAKKLDNLNKSIDLKKRVADANRADVQAARDVIKQYEDSYTNLTKSQESLEQIQTKENDRVASIKQTVEETDELDAITSSIFSNSGKYKNIENETLLLTIEHKKSLESISNIVSGLGETQSQLNEQSSATNTAYKNLNTSILSSKQDLEDNKISQEEFAVNVVDSYKNFDKLIQKIDTSTEEGQKLSDEYKNQRDFIGKLVDIETLLKKTETDRIKGFSSLNSEVNKITSGFEKHSEISELVKVRQEQIKKNVDDIGTAMVSIPETQKELKDQAENTASAYINVEQQLISSKRELLDNKITQEEYNSKILDSYKNFDKLIGKIDISTEHGKKLVELYTEQKNKLGEQIDIQTLTKNVEASRIKGYTELNQAISTITNGLNQHKELSEVVNSRQEEIKSNINDISSSISKIPENQKELKEQAENTASAYINVEQTLLSSKKELLNNKITQDEYNSSILDAYKSFDKVIQSIDTSTDSGKELVKLYTEQKQKLGEQIDIQNLTKNVEISRIDGLKNLNQIMDSITSDYKEQQKLSEIVNARQESIKTTINSIGQLSSVIPKNQKELKSQVDAASTGYVDMEYSILNANKQLAEGKINLEEYNKIILQSDEDFEKLISKIDTSTNEGKELVKTFTNARNSMQSFVGAAKKSKKQMEGLESVIDEIGSSGIPGINELGNVIKKLANKDVPGAKMAFVGLMAAVGALATKYFAAPWQVDIEMKNERISNQIDALRQAGVIQVEFEAKSNMTNALQQLQQNGGGGVGEITNVVGKAGEKLKKSAKDVSLTDLYKLKEYEKLDLEIAQQEKESAVDIGNIRNKLNLETAKSKLDNEEEILKLQNDASFAAERAANSFSASMKQAAAQFRAASKTALFGNKLGGVGYGAAQLQMAGISAEKIAGAMSTAAAATGKMPTGKAAADMAIMAERTGQSVESIAQINEYFQRTDKVSADVAMNMQEGMRAMADNAGISLSNLMTEVAAASKEALGYQIKSGPALAKQVAYAQSLGVSFGDVAKAGKNMVMNYKDSIKAEMQLSTLLGEQVDLSEVRAKFAEGDTEGALKSLQAQGLNPEDMDMFQQEALSQALGGMDLSSLQKISQNKGAEVGPLKQGKAGAANQDYLKRNVAAQSVLNTEQAQISAQQAILDAQTSQKVLENFLADKGGKLQDIRKRQIEQEINQLKNEIDQRKKKIDVSLDQELVARQRFIDELGMAYDALLKNAETSNPLIKKAAAEQKQLEVTKGFSENILTAVGGGASVLTGNYLKNKFFKSAGQKTTESVEKTALKTGEQKVGQSFLKEGEVQLEETVTKKFVQSSEVALEEGLEKGFLKGGNIYTKAIVGTLGLVGIGATAYAASGGGDKVPTPDEYAAAVAQDQQQQQTVVTQSTPDANLMAANSSEMQSGFSNLCSCVGALAKPLDQLQMLSKIQKIMASNTKYSQLMAQATAATKKAGMIGAGVSGVATGVGELAANTVIKTLEFGGTKLAQNAGFEGMKDMLKTLIGQSSKQVGKQALTETAEVATMQAGKNVATEVGENALAQSGKNITVEIAEDSLIQAGKTMATEVGEDVAVNVAKSSLGSTLKSSLFSGTAVGGMGLGIGGAVLSGFGDMEKKLAEMNGDMGQLNTGRWLDVAGKAATYASYGLVLGSAIPVIGNVVGGVVGGIVGAAVGIFDNFFSSQSEEEERRVKEMEEAKRKAEENKAAFENLIAINKSVDTRLALDQQTNDRLATIAGDEPTWRESVLAQLIEATRFLQMILFKDTLGDGVMVGGQKVTYSETAATFDKSKQIGAEKLGIMQQYSDRQLKILEAQNNIDNTGKITKGEYTGKTYAEMIKGMGVQNFELADISQKQKTNAMASAKQSQMAAEKEQQAVTTARQSMNEKQIAIFDAYKNMDATAFTEYKKTNKVSESQVKNVINTATKNLQGTGVTLTQGMKSLTGAQVPAGTTTPTGTVVAGTPAATPAGTVVVTPGAPQATPAGGVVPAGGAAPAAGATAGSTEATLKLIQTQADTRGILMYTLMQAMNTTLQSMNTNLVTLISWVETGKQNQFALMNSKLDSMMTWFDTSHTNNFTSMNEKFDKVIEIMQSPTTNLKEEKNTTSQSVTNLGTTAAATANNKTVGTTNLGNAAAITNLGNVAGATANNKSATVNNTTGGLANLAKNATSVGIGSQILNQSKTTNGGTTNAGGSFGSAISTLANQLQTQTQNVLANTVNIQSNDKQANPGKPLGVASMIGASAANVTKTNTNEKLEELQSENNSIEKAENNKLIDINGNAQRVIARADKIATYAMSTDNSMKNLNLQVKQLVAINEGIQKLIDASVAGTEGRIKLMIDGKPVMRMIQRREDNNKGQDAGT
jgi:hypothetical protein